MSMRYGIVFILMGLCCLVPAAREGGLGWLWLWPSIAFVIVGIGYLKLGPRVFGKRPDGTMSPVRLIVLAPFVLFAWVIWAIHAVTSREPAGHEVVPGLWLSRRLRMKELPQGLTLIVDLTCELWEPRTVRSACRYVCVPTLDAAAPQIEEIVRMVEGAAGPVLIHCAQGHGRSAAVVAAVLARREIARGCDEALRMVKVARPGIRLNSVQYASLAKACRPSG